MKFGENRLGTRASTLVLALACVGVLASTPSSAIAQQEIEPGEKSPLDGIVLTDLEGGQVRLSDLTGQPLIIVLGELNQNRTRRVCSDLASLFTMPEMQGTNASSLLIMAHDPAGTASEHILDASERPDTTLLDPRRDAFGAFHVIVLPTIIVLDKQGQILHAMPGIVPRMPEIVLAAVRLANGNLTSQEFELVLDPPAKIELTEEQKRVSRLVKMAEKMRVRGLLNAAEEQFKEAVSIDPVMSEARIGLGRVLFDKGVLDQALHQFNAALKIEPDSIEALLGASFVQVASGEEGIAKAQRTVLLLLESSPGNAQVHFLAGLVHQSQGECEEACAAFKHAAELLLDLR